MKTTGLMAAFAMIGTCAALAAGENTRPQGAAAGATNRMEVVREAIARRERQTGGVLTKPGTGEGRIAFVNCQEKFGQDALEDIAQQLGRLSRLNIISVKGKKDLDPAEVCKAHGVDVAVMLADRPGKPLMLLAPEDGWGEVNVARIPAGEKFNAGCCKELLRAFGPLCGGGLSMQQGNILSEVRLEKTYDLQNTLPQDVTIRQLKYLAEMGVKPQTRTTYRKACEEGWAPAPTNDVQKAIWEKVKADKERGPTNPITIPPPIQKKK